MSFLILPWIYIKIMKNRRFATKYPYLLNLYNFTCEKMVTKITVSFVKRVANNRNICYNATNENLRKKGVTTMFKKLLCLCLAVSVLLGLFVLAPATRAASDMKTSEEGIAFIKNYEGFSGTPYKDGNRYSIGYGTKCPDDMVEHYTQTPMTKEEADAEMRSVLASFEKAVNKFIDDHSLTFEQRQFDAVVSLVYNCGTSYLTRGTTLIAALTNDVTESELIYAFCIYNKSKGSVSVPHVKRRMAEANIYLNGEYTIRIPENFGYVVYDGNGGTVVDYNVQGYLVEQTPTVIPTATYEGYIFQGWFTDVTEGQQVTMLDATTRNITLYAQWEVDPNYVPPETVSPSEPSISESSDPSESSVPEGTDPVEPVIPDGTSIDPVLVEVTSDTVNLRKGPGLSFAVVGSVEKGDKLNITATYEADDYLWGKFELGWVCLENTDFGKEKPEPEPETVDVQVTGSNVNVRQGPGLSYSVVGQVNTGDQLTIIGEPQESDGYLWGQFDGGWIALKYTNYGEVTEEKPTEPEQPTEPEPEKPTEPEQPTEPEPEKPVTVTKTYATVIKTSTLNIREVPDGKVVGMLYLGDRVEILEQKTVAGRAWGRCEQGWICIRTYAQLETVTETIGGSVQPKPETPTEPEPETPTEPETPAEPEPPVTVTKTYGTVINTVTQNVRKSPNGAIIDKLYLGDRGEILEQKTVNGVLWGRCEKGWVNMRTYIKLETVTQTVGSITQPDEKPDNQPDQEPEEEKPVTVTKTYGTVIKTTSLNIRKTPDGTVVGWLGLGQRVEILEQKTVAGRLWGRCEQGWICMRSYVKLETVTETVGATEKPTAETGTITATCLNIRSGAGTNNAVVGQLYKGATVEILEKKTVNGTVWARINKGWISMKYVA